MKRKISSTDPLSFEPISLDSPRFTTLDGSEISWGETIGESDKIQFEPRTLVESYNSTKDQFMIDFNSSFMKETGISQEDFVKYVYDYIDTFIRELGLFYSAIQSKDPKLVKHKRADISDFLKNVNFPNLGGNVKWKYIFIKCLYNLLKSGKYVFLNPFHDEIIKIYTKYKSELIRESDIKKAYHISRSSIERNIKSEYINYKYWKYVESKMKYLDTLIEKYESDISNFNKISEELKNFKKSSGLEMCIYDNLFNTSLKKYFPILFFD